MKGTWGGLEFTSIQSPGKSYYAWCIVNLLHHLPLWNESCIVWTSCHTRLHNCTGRIRFHSLPCTMQALHNWTAGNKMDETTVTNKDENNVLKPLTFRSFPSWPMRLGWHQCWLSACSEWSWQTAEEPPCWISHIWRREKDGSSNCDSQAPVRLFSGWSESWVWLPDFTNLALTQDLRKKP